MILRSLDETIKNQKGVLFTLPAIVYRGAYSGRDLIAKNSDPQTDVDERKYFPVECWIVSKTTAENDIVKPNEGISQFLLHHQQHLIQIPLPSIAQIADTQIFGEYANKWPLTKILDIGGRPVKPNFSSSTEEVPPIPAHVHNGKICDGKACGNGKKEAYFFPPLDVAPYHKNFGKVITRLGIKPEITKIQFEDALKKFGKTDEMYDLLNIYDIQAYDGWTIEPGVIHAPGPWLTFEIQRPQDDFNLASWRLGQVIEDPQELEKAREAFLMRGLTKEKDWVDQLVKWDLSCTPSFKENYYRPAKVISEGEWGRTIQIFFDGFYGEGFEIKAGKTYVREADKRPFGGIVWSGNGKINGNTVDCENRSLSEFLVTPLHPVTIEAEENLLIYVVFPLEE